VNVYGDSSGIVALAGTFAIAGARSPRSRERDRGVRVRGAVAHAHRERIAPGPCASVGVHENAPVVPSIVAPAGAPTSENVSVCAGQVAVRRGRRERVGRSSGIVALAGTFAIAGAAFASVTCSVIAASVFACRRSRAP
jgi:hypothetical protein